MYGLSESNIEEIFNQVSRFLEIEKAVLFGSRAKGNYKSGSDVDIPILGDNVSHSTIVSLSELLNEESMMPYKFDIISYNSKKSEFEREYTIMWN